ncbi:MAG TPA: 6-phosphogluconolactonase [Pyrinomonadaceae bacterium]|nr:6-phosphogluconolactonase [Pyrinomonadaceae bacterium]
MASGLKEIKVFPTTEELGRAAVEIFCEAVEKARKRNSTACVALSGGSSPKVFYRSFRKDEFDFSKINFFFSDERNVPPDDEQSNYRLALNELFIPHSINTENVFRWAVEKGAPEEVADDYEEVLTRKLFLSQTETESQLRAVPRFDCLFLGVGTDGHIASLFPSTQGLKENNRFAIANWVPQLDSFRYTMTFPVINNSAVIMVLAHGRTKADILERILVKEDKSLPAANLNPNEGCRLIWLIDEQAAAKI